MKVLVLGCGIVGVTSAYFLGRDGHEVHVIDRQPIASNETSWGNAGMVSPGHAYTWASPRAPKMLLRSLFYNDTALKLKWRFDPQLFSWGLKFLTNCNTEKVRENTGNKLRLCLYSRESLHDLLADAPVEFHHIQDGAVFLYRTQESFESGVRNTRILTDNGLTLETLTPAEVVAREPGLQNMQDKIAGAIYSPIDESGDCHLFSQRLVEVCKERFGATFHFGATIQRIEASGDRVTKVVTDRGDFTADAYVLALGSYSPIESRKIGLDLPIYPVKGYSLTLPIEGRNTAPRLSGVDENNLVAWSRLGDRLRVTSTAEFAGYDWSHEPKDFENMMRTTRELFPDAVDYDRPKYWAGLRPMTPTNAPILGQAKHKNLWLNTGQGHMGWTMSFGSSRVTADLIAGRKPAIDLKGMTYADAA